ncbi:hypothetical protein [Nevskia sp.]|uniref:hypothetical protein n=1 Tax=Nevskia sp. TaxID=1929292 RepID=UPI0025F7CA3F|nr:hypothetical protein [Nevskia sp.]
MQWNETLTVYFERSGALQTYWNFYVTIVLALIAFFGTVKPSEKLTRVAALITAAYIVFAIVNLDALLDVTRQRLVLQAIITEQLGAMSDTKAHAAKFKAIVATLRPPNECGVIVVHVLGDIFILSAVWFLTIKKHGVAQPGAPADRPASASLRQDGG